MILSASNQLQALYMAAERNADGMASGKDDERRSHVVVRAASNYARSMMYASNYSGMELDILVRVTDSSILRQIDPQFSH